MSLAMAQYFAECPDPIILQHYVACMEAFSNFVHKLASIHSTPLTTLLAKLG